MCWWMCDTDVLFQLLNKLKKSAEKLAKEDENYYQKNMAGCSTRVKWEKTLENCYQVS